MRRIMAVFSVAAVVAATMAMAGAAFAAPNETDADALQELASVRQVTAKYHDVNKAIADGYVPNPHCIEVPGLGGMGHHYLNPELASDLSVDPLKPELLLYAPAGNGKLKLVGVEYFVANVGQEKPPTVFGHPFDGPMAGHEPGMPEHYDLHVWTWEANPNGIFAQFNPNVRC